MEEYKRRELFEPQFEPRFKETATISIERFIDLIKRSNALEERSYDLLDLQGKYARLKSYVLEEHFRDWYINDNSCVDFNSSLFAISDKDELRQMGISVEEQEEYVRFKKNEHELKKESEE